jgi:hypothetical protein
VKVPTAPVTVALCRATTPGRAVKRRSLRNLTGIFGKICPARPGDTDRSPAYFLYMLSTLLVIGGVLVGLLVLLALIVSLSARPQTTARGTATAGRAPSWVVDAGRPHPDAWSPMSSTTTNEIPAVRAS